MRAVFVLAVLAVILVLIVVAGRVARRRAAGDTVAVGAARGVRRRRDEGDGGQAGQAPLLVARVPFDSEDFDGQLFEARSEGRARVSALNQKS